MIFQEKKTKTGYEYKCEEIFGVVDMKSDIKLTGDMLDGVISILLKGKKAETVTGDIKHNKGVLSYIFKPTPTWSDDDEETCENTHTSTKKPVREFIRARLLKIPILSWLLRFVEALKEALKNTQ